MQGNPDLQGNFAEDTKSVLLAHQQRTNKFCGDVQIVACDKRADVFFRHVPIKQNPVFGPQDPQYFRLSALEEADTLRHDIIHRNGLLRVNLGQSTDTMLFLHEAANVALRSLGYAYSLRFDPAILTGQPPKA